jgi:hypothetical protein
MPDFHTAWMDANSAAAPLHDRAMTLGYNVGVSIGGELGAQDAQASFWVRRFDQPAENLQTFATTEPVSHHLDHLETMPIYCLELVDNPRIDVTTDEKGTATWITDTETGELFGVRTADLETVTRLCVHAESAPSVGNWEP